jgi:hypothetical protein
LRYLTYIGSPLAILLFAMMLPQKGKCSVSLVVRFYTKDPDERLKGARLDNR